MEGFNPSGISIRKLIYFFLSAFIVFLYAIAATIKFSKEAIVVSEPLTSVSATTPDGSKIVQFGVDNDGMAFPVNGTLSEGFSLVRKKVHGRYVMGIYCISKTPWIESVPSESVDEKASK